MKINNLKKTIIVSGILAVTSLSALEPDSSSIPFKGLTNEKLDSTHIMASLGMNCAAQVGLLKASYYHASVDLSWAQNYSTNASLFLNNDVIITSMVVPAGTMPYAKSVFTDFNGKEHVVEKWVMYVQGSQGSGDQYHLFLGKLDTPVTGVLPFVFHEGSDKQVDVMVASMDNTKDVRMAGCLVLGGKTVGDRTFYADTNNKINYRVTLGPSAEDGRLTYDTGAPAYVNGIGSAAPELIALGTWAFENNGIPQFLGLDGLKGSWTTGRLEELGVK